MTNSIETAGSCSNKITKAYQKQPGVVIVLKQQGVVVFR
jgi:hypothetical protein